MESTQHLHADRIGDHSSTDGSLQVCYDEACMKWATSNARAVNTLGGAVIGALFGAAVGYLAKRPAAGALVGAAIGAGIARIPSEQEWTGPTVNGIPLLPPRPVPLAP